MNFRWKIAQFFESRWWESYLRAKPVAGYLAWKKDYWQTLMRKENIKVLPNEKVLDAGCGPAGVFLVLENCSVLAIDPLLDEYQQRIDHFDTKNYAHVQFKKMTLEQFVRINHFDKVFCLNAINHVADLDKSMNNLCRAVKDNGMLYLSIDAHRFSILKKLFRFIPGDVLHPHQLNLAEYEALLKKNGIDIESRSLLKRSLIFDYYLIKGNKRITQSSNFV